MKLNSLINEIYNLGFEDTVVKSDTLFSAIRRAQREIYTEYPEEKMLRVILPKAMPCVRYPLIAGDGASAKFPLPGNAFSFKVCGRGCATVTDKGGTRQYEFDTPRGIIRGFLSEGAEMSFSGVGFTVCDLASFSGAFSELDAIPIYYPERECRMSLLCEDFLSFSTLPADASGVPIKNSRISGESVFLPCEVFGEITLFYNRLPRDIDPDFPDSEVDAPACAAHLLPLLAAAYMWLDDDGDRSVYYMQLYRSGMERVKGGTRRVLSHEYTDTLRWI